MDGDRGNIIKIIDELLPPGLIEIKLFPDIVLRCRIRALPYDKAGWIPEPLEQEKYGYYYAQKDQQSVKRSSYQIA